MELRELRAIAINEGREIRAVGEMPAIDETNRLTGYALRYMSQSHPLYEPSIGQFREVILPTAFDEWLATKPDIKIYTHHDQRFITGRTSSGTLSIVSDGYGLRFINELPNTTYANDLKELIGRGDIVGMSFEFIVEQDQVMSVGPELVREVRKASIYAINPVIDPAYPQTRVNVRSIQEFIAASTEPEAKQLKEIPLSYFQQIIRAYR